MTQLRRIGLLVLVLAVARSVSAQAPLIQGQLSAANATIQLPTQGFGGAGFGISGTWSGTITFECSDAGSNWTALNASATNSSSSATTTTSNGTFQATVTGCINVRARMSSFSSGTAVVSLVGVPNGVAPASISVSSSGNAAAGPTGSAVPASADYTGVNIGGNLNGVTGFSVGTQKAIAMAIVDGSGNQITSFGGGTQYTNGSAQATPTGTVALGWDTANVRALSTDSSGHLQIVFNSPQAVTQSGGWTVSATQSGNWTSRIVGNAGGVLDAAGQNASSPANQLLVGGQFNTSPTTITTGNMSPLQLTSAGRLIVDGSQVTQPVSQSGTWTVQPGNTANTTPWLFSISQGGNTAAVNASSQLSVNCANCSGSGVSQVDNTGFTYGSSNFAPVGGVYNTSITNLTSGDAGAFALTNNRKVHVALFDNAGTALNSTSNALNVYATNTLNAGAADANTLRTADDLRDIAGSAVVTAATGVQKVGIVGNAGAAVDAAGQNVGSPANEFLVGAQFNTSPTTLTSGNMSPLQLTSAARLIVDGSQVTQPVSGTVTTTPPSNASTNVTQWNSVALGSPSNYGTSPGAVSVPGVNAFVTNTPSVAQSGTWTVQQGGAPWADNLTQLNSVALGSPSNYGTSPGAVNVAGVNAFVTNTPSVAQSGAWTVTSNQGTPAALANAWPVRETDGTLQTQFDYTNGGIKVSCPNCLSTVNINGGGLRRATVGFSLTGSLGQPLGDRIPISTLSVNKPDPCVDPTHASSAAISQTGSTQIIAGQPGKLIYVCHYTVVGSDAENLSWVEGTGATCGTGTLAVIGGTTAAAGMNFAANGGVNAGDGVTWIASTAVPGDNLCLLQSGSGRVGGSVKYANQ